MFLNDGRIVPPACLTSPQLSITSTHAVPVHDSPVDELNIQCAVPVLGQAQHTQAHTSKPACTTRALLHITTAAAATLLLEALILFQGPGLEVYDSAIQRSFVAASP